MASYSYADSGVKYTKESNGFLFEFGMDLAAPKSLDYVTMTLAMYNATTGDLAVPDRLIIRISKTDTALFPPESFQAKQDSVAIFRYTFPEGGNYAIEFAASQSDKKGNATFEFFVERSVHETTPSPMIAIVAVVAVILVLTQLFIELTRRL